MSPKMPFSPRIYWLICTLLFFLFWGCSFTKSLLRKGGSEASRTSILVSKYPKKLNPKFYAEGSTYYRFIERNADISDPIINEWELTFLVYDKEFLSSVRTNYPSADYKTYKLAWRKKQGTYVLHENKKDFIATYSKLSSGEANANTLSELLTQLAQESKNYVKIRDLSSFYVEGDFAYLTAESMTGDGSAVYEWKNERPSSDTSPPRSIFLSVSKEGKPIKYSSSHYDYFQFQFEVFDTEPTKLFYKSIYAEDKVEIYFLPPISNQVSTKPKEPVGFQRIGDYLIREESP